MNALDTRVEPSLSVAVTQLMKGVVYRDTHAAAWQHLAALQPQVRDYVAVLGLVVVIDESESVFEKVCCGRRGGMTSTGETGRVARCLHAVA
ncbi:DUF4194 domain-containing protein, partial [Micromonospora sp. NPDC004336]